MICSTAHRSLAEPLASEPPNTLPPCFGFQSGDCVTGSLEVFSSTGGLLCLVRNL